MINRSDLRFIEGIISVADSNFKFVEETGKRFALAMRTALKNLKPNRELVLNARACKESDENIQQSSGNLKIFLTEYLLKSHELHVGETVWVKKLNPFPLERVLVGFYSKEKYLWAQESLATFLLDSLTSGPVTVRENSTLYFPNDQEQRPTEKKGEECSQMLILQCDPMLQGCITSETSLVITKLEETEIPFVSKINKTKSVAVSSDSLENFLVSDFTHDLAQGLSRDLSGESTSQGRAHQLRVRVLNYNKTNNDLSYDASSRVYVSVATLINLHLFHGCWVKICRNSPHLCADGKQEDEVVESASSSQGKHVDESSSTTTECHFVQLLAAASKSDNNDYLCGEDTTCIYPLADGDEIEDGVIYIAPLLYFNLFSKFNSQEEPPHAVYISPNCDTTTLVNAESSTASKTGKPPFATEAHISLVHSPYYKAGDSFDGALASYFKAPRILTVGDVFFVHHDWQRNSDARKVSGVADDQGQRDVVVYFKVTQLVCESGKAKSCFVDVEHTSLYQVSG